MNGNAKKGDLTSMRVEQVRVLKAPRERVFQAFTDYDSVPKWQTLFTRVTVTKREGNTVYLEMETNAPMMGRVIRRETHVLTPPEQVQVEGEMQGVTNTTLWKFEPVPEGTRLAVTANIVYLPLRFRVLSPIVRRRFNTLLRDWLQELANYVEKQ